VYTKSNGECYFGLFLERGLSWWQAFEKCRSLGGRLPEIKSAQENADILKLKVILSISSRIG
jgi:hypothetical protein